MKKINKITLLALFAFFLCLAKNGTAQVSKSSDNGSKTVIYKIKKHDNQNALTAQEATNIDKLLTSKKGIISSTTNAANRTVNVKMISTGSEEEVKKILGSVLKLEVESFEVTDNTK